MSINALDNSVVTLILLPLMLILLVGCAMNADPSSEHLLEQDYRSLSNTELTAYEQVLSDHINQSSASGFRGSSIGLGFGSWGSHSGVGVGVGQFIAGGSDPAMELRARRDAVRTEMRKRGLLPPSPGAVVPSGTGRFFS